MTQTANNGVPRRTLRRHRGQRATQAHASLHISALDLHLSHVRDEDLLRFRQVFLRDRRLVVEMLEHQGELLLRQRPRLRQHPAPLRARLQRSAELHKCKHLHLLVRRQFEQCEHCVCVRVCESERERVCVCA